MRSLHTDDQYAHQRDNYQHGAEQEPSRGKVAFVLSGGAARGAIQVGMLRVLLQRGIVPDLIVGTSVGAFNGAWLAAMPTTQGIERLEAIWSQVRYDDIFGGGPMTVLLHLVRRLPSLYGGEAIQRFLERIIAESKLESAHFDHLQVPLAVVATNLTRGRPEIFDRGQLIPALLASAAIPAILPPVMIDGEQYVDGGLLDNVGLCVAVERGARDIYVLDTSWDGQAQQLATTLDAVIERSVEVVAAFHLQCAIERYAKRARVVVLRDDGRVVCSGADFSAVGALIAAGRDIAEQVLAAPRQESARAIQQRRAAAAPSLRQALQSGLQSGWHAWRSRAVWGHAVSGWVSRLIRPGDLAPRRADIPTANPPTPLPAREAQRAAS